MASPVTPVPDPLYLRTEYGLPESNTEGVVPEVPAVPDPPEVPDVADPAVPLLPLLPSSPGSPVNVTSQVLKLPDPLTTNGVKVNWPVEEL